MLNAGPGGFQNAPLSKATCLGVASWSLLVSLTTSQSTFELVHLSSLTESGQVWRLITNLLFFSSAGELIFGLILLYNFRFFERQLGTRKFGSFVFISFVFSILYQLTTLVLSQSAYAPSITPSLTPSSSSTTRVLVSGPYVYIFMCFVLFYRTVPVTSRFRVMGIPGTNKIFLYLVGCQLLFSSYSAMLVSLFGLCAGIAYESDSIGGGLLKHFRVPTPVCALCSRLFLPFLEVSLSATTGARGQAQVNAFRHGRVAGGVPQRGLGQGPLSARQQQQLQQQIQQINEQAQQAQQQQQQVQQQQFAVIPPSSNNVATLEGMGFSADQANRALAQAHDNLQMATNLLLDGVVQ